MKMQSNCNATNSCNQNVVTEMQLNCNSSATIFYIKADNFYVSSRLEAIA